MKKLIFIATGILLVSCNDIHVIGNAHVISTKHINTSEGEVLASPTFKDKEIRKAAEKTVDKAIDVTLAKYPGATHMTNVRIYAVDKVGGTRYAVIGDVVKGK